MPAAQAFPAAAWKWFFCFAAEGQREGPVPGQPRQEEVRVPRPLAKDTWAATHAGVHLDIGGDPPTLVRSTAHALQYQMYTALNAAALWPAHVNMYILKKNGAQGKFCSFCTGHGSMHITALAHMPSVSCKL